jgi:hypothetical protein
VSPARLVLTLALLGAAVPALAQEQKPAAPAAKPAEAKPAPAKPAAAAPVKPAATELARVLMPRKTWSGALDQLGQMVQARLTMHPGSSSAIEYPKDMPAKVKTELEGVLPYEDLIGMHARELSAGFTDGELADLLGFYRSPTGQKALSKMGEVQSKIGLETQQRIESKMPDIMKKLSAMGKVAPGKEGASKDGAPAGQKPAGHP